MKGKHAALLGLAFVLVVGAFLAMTLTSKDTAPEGSVRVVAASDVEWQHLNPLRGDKSPRAGTLWGDRQAPVPCGFLVKFVDGFSSPPHIHPVTYRGVVVSGVVHNDDPEAAKRWLAPGSFWTQPAGEVHITAAKGSDNVAYIEIEKGPYLVHPAKDAFQPPEEAVWLEPSAMPWVDAPGMPADAGVKVAALAGNPGNDRLKRSLLKLPAGSRSGVQSGGADFHAVLIQGRLRHDVRGKSGKRTLEPGSYFGSTGNVEHRIACDADTDCVIYVRTEGTFDISRLASDE